MSLNLMYWIPSLAFIAHIGEELPGFPEWATRHFGVTSRAWYVYSHIPLILASVAVSDGAVHSPLGSTWGFLATAAACVLLTNGLFHLTTTVLFREYSPGVVTGVALFFPGGGYVLWATAHERVLTMGELGWAVGLGALVGALVIASLWLRMDLDWRLRRSPR